MPSPDGRSLNEPKGEYTHEAADGRASNSSGGGDEHTGMSSMQNLPPLCAGRCRCGSVVEWLK